MHDAVQTAPHTVCDIIINGKLLHVNGNLLQIFISAKKFF